MLKHSKLLKIFSLCKLGIMFCNNKIDGITHNL